MRSFTDNLKRTWEVPINVGSIQRVRDTGVDLLKVVEGRETVDKLADPITLVSVLYAICKKQLETKGISAEDFGEAMGGDAIDDALAALLEGLAEFFPKHQRPALKTALAKANQAQQILGSKALAKAEAIDVDKIVQAAMQDLQSHVPAAPPTSGETSTVTPASSE